MKYKQNTTTKRRLAVRWIILVAALVAVWFISSPASGLEAGGLDIARFIFPSGGGASEDGSFALFSSIAQPLAGAESAGSGFTLSSGFLAGGETIGTPVPKTEHIFLPIIVKE